MENSSIGVSSTETQSVRMKKRLISLEKMAPKAVGRRLKAARESTGLGPSEFADTVDIDRSSYTKIEKGDKPLKADMAFAISERWDFPMEFFYKGTLHGLPEQYSAIVIKNLTTLEP